MGNAKKVPLRKCIGCNQMKDKRDMIRVIRTTDTQVLRDTTGRMNGRGAYLCFSQECLGNAIKNRGLERSLKMQIPQEIYDRLEKEMSEIE